MDTKGGMRKISDDEEYAWIKMNRRDTILEHFLTLV
jgi:hypothetical protein